MSGGGGGTQRVTSTATIPAFLEPFVEQQAVIGNQALETLQAQLQDAGSAELVSPFSSQQQQAFDMIEGIALGDGGYIPTAQNAYLSAAQDGSFSNPLAMQALESTARGDYLYGGDGFDQAVQASIRAAAPGILSTFGGAGRGTGGLAQTAFQEVASDAFADQFSAERQRQLAAASALNAIGAQEQSTELQAASALPGIATSGAGLLSNVGAQYQSQAQRELTAPLTAQEMLLNAAGGGVPLAAAIGQTQTQPVQGGNGLVQGLGALGSIASIAGPLISLSDERLKRDVSRIGERNELGVYLFRYLWSPVWHIGHMAQEVIKVRPDAVVEIDGYLAVDYGALA